jgi:cytoskeletal protein CcmA (bactofilin family)
MTNEHNENMHDLDDVVESQFQDSLGQDDRDSEDQHAGQAVPLIKPSVISEGFEFTGEIRAPGALGVEGVITGKLAVDSLTIGAQGIVNGEVAADTVNVKGKFSGQMVCQDITIGGRSVVDADLTYASIVVQRGGVVKGDLHKK